MLKYSTEYVRAVWFLFNSPLATPESSYVAPWPSLCTFIYQLNLEPFKLSVVRLFWLKSFRLFPRSCVGVKLSNMYSIVALVCCIGVASASLCCVPPQWESQGSFLTTIIYNGVPQVSRVSKPVYSLLIRTLQSTSTRYSLQVLVTVYKYSLQSTSTRYSLQVLVTVYKYSLQSTCTRYSLQVFVTVYKYSLQSTSTCI